MPYKERTIGGRVRLTANDEPVIYRLKGTYGTSATFEVLGLRHYAGENYPVYTLQQVGGFCTLELNGRFLDDGTIPYGEELRQQAVTALKAYVAFQKEQGLSVDVEGLLL